MNNQFVLSPFFLDQAEAEMLHLAGADWKIIPAAGEAKHTTDDPRQSARIQSMTQLYRTLAAEVKNAVESGRRPVCVLGDCCATIGIQAGLRQAGLHPILIWLDSHGDYNTWETTPSGFLGGMPLAMMVGRGDQRLLEGVGLSPIPETDVILSDARDLDPGERLLVEDSTLLHVADVASLLSLELTNRPLYVHFDIDVLSLDDAPAVSYPAQGGPTYADMQRLMHRLAATGRVVAVSMTTWNFTMDTDRKTEQACLPLFYTLLGEQ